MIGNRLESTVHPINAKGFSMLTEIHAQLVGMFLRATKR